LLPNAGSIDATTPGISWREHSRGTLADWAFRSMPCTLTSWSLGREAEGILVVMAGFLFLDSMRAKRCRDLVNALLTAG
jgi:hypothetical protein